MEKANKKKRRMKPIKKLLLLLLVVALIIGGFIGYQKFFKKDNAKKVKVVDSIKNEKVDYVVNENDSKLFKKTFEELKEVLNAKKVDNKKYAETISKLFVIDFFTLSNKTSKNDVGGVQFVFEGYKTTFVEYARDGIYKQVLADVDDENANKNLPTVKSVKVNSVEEVSPAGMFATPFAEDAVGYEVRLSWTYENDDSFQSEAVIIVAPDGDKLSLVKMD